MTRKLNLTAKYSELLSKKAREEFVQESEIEVESAPPVEREVLVLISSVNLVHSKLERT